MKTYHSVEETRTKILNKLHKKAKSKNILFLILSLAFLILTIITSTFSIIIVLTYSDTPIKTLIDILPMSILICVPAILLFLVYKVSTRSKYKKTTKETLTLYEEHIEHKYFTEKEEVVCKIRYDNMSFIHLFDTGELLIKTTKAEEKHKNLKTLSCYKKAANGLPNYFLLMAFEEKEELMQKISDKIKYYAQKYKESHKMEEL